ncbi:MAG: hypothetical protein ACRCS6_03490 [Turicibacter sp.]
MEKSLLRIGFYLFVILGVALLSIYYFNWFDMKISMWIGTSLFISLMSLISLFYHGTKKVKENTNPYNITGLLLGIIIFIGAFSIMKVETLIFICFIIACLVFCIAGLVNEVKNRADK